MITADMLLKLLVLHSVVLAHSGWDYDDEDDELGEDEVGTVPEDLSEYTRQGAVLYKTLWRPRHCDVKTKDGDDVTMMMEYYGVREDGRNFELEKAVALQLKKGQTINDVKDGLLGICLGEKRRLVIEDKKLWNKFAEILPDMLNEIQTFLDVEVTGINEASWQKYDSGLKVAFLEPVASENCARTVQDGDVLSVEYKGQLEDGTVFDSSESRGAPFGPFVQGRRQIIEGYTQALKGKCLGERWRMIVPPHLAYGDHGTGDIIPGGATLTFHVRLVQLNDDHWTRNSLVERVLGWETDYIPEPCEEMAGYYDKLFIHFRAVREDGTEFGTLVDNSDPYGPFVLSGAGTTVPGLDAAVPGMCLGERRTVRVPPRLGWRSGHHDTITVEVMLVRINDHDWKRLDEKEEL